MVAMNSPVPSRNAAQLKDAPLLSAARAIRSWRGGHQAACPVVHALRMIWTEDQKDSSL
jgi:hypothetical protein